MRELISQHEARERGLTRYFTGGPCKHGHICERHVSTRGCVECSQGRRDAYKEANPHRMAAYARGWHTRNAALSRARARKWNKENAEYTEQYISGWRQRNKAKLTSYAVKRKASRIAATPVWLTGEHIAQMELVYATAQAMTEALKEPYEVDHEIPLNSPYVCGLHVPWNLQILPQQTNRIKSNKLAN